MPPFISWKFKWMSDPWPAIKMLASEILTKLTNLSYLLFLSCTVITAHRPALPFLCKQGLILLKDRGAWSSLFFYVPLFLKETLSFHVLGYAYSWRRQIITFGKLPTVPCAVLSAGWWDHFRKNVFAQVYFWNAEKHFFTLYVYIKTLVLV